MTTRAHNIMLAYTCNVFNVCLLFTYTRLFNEQIYIVNARLCRINAVICLGVQVLNMLQLTIKHVLCLFQIDAYKFNIFFQ